MTSWWRYPRSIVPVACESVWPPTSSPATVTPGRITGSGTWAAAAGASSVVKAKTETRNRRIRRRVAVIGREACPAASAPCGALRRGPTASDLRGGGARARGGSGLGPEAGGTDQRRAQRRAEEGEQPGQ